MDEGCCRCMCAPRHTLVGVWLVSDQLNVVQSLQELAVFDICTLAKWGEKKRGDGRGCTCAVTLLPLALSSFFRSSNSLSFRIGLPAANALEAWRNLDSVELHRQDRQDSAMARSHPSLTLVVQLTIMHCQTFSR